MAKEGLPTLKYPSLNNFMRNSHVCKQFDALSYGKNASYDTRYTADYFQNIIASQIEHNIITELKQSSYSHIKVKEKMVLYLRYVDALMTSKTRFLANIYVQGKIIEGKIGRITSSVIYEALEGFRVVQK